MSQKRVIAMRPRAAGAAPDTPPALPHDPMTADRLRRMTRAIVLAARTPVLLAGGLLKKRPAPPVETLVQRLLVVRTDRLGDMALTTAALADLRAHFRHARITVLAPPGPLALLVGHPAADHLVPLAGRRLPAELAGRFDMVIDFTPDESLAGARIAAATRAPWRVGFAAAGRQVFFTLPCPPARPEAHIVDLNRDLLAAIGVPRRDTAPQLHITAAERAAALQRCAGLGAAQPRVLVHPGGHFATQRWPEERFAEVIERLTESTGAACLVAGGPDDEARVRGIVRSTPDALPVAPLEVRALMGLTAVSDLFIGNNSGPLHVAAALGIPTLSIAGPTDLRRFAPRGPADEVIRRELACSPCGRGRCWHHTCLASIGADEVVAIARVLIEQVPARRAA